MGWESIVVIRWDSIGSQLSIFSTSPVFTFSYRSLQFFYKDNIALRHRILNLFLVLISFFPNMFSGFQGWLQVKCSPLACFFKFPDPVNLFSSLIRTQESPLLHRLIPQSSAWWAPRSWGWRHLGTAKEVISIQAETWYLSCFGSFKTEPSFFHQGLGLRQSLCHPQPLFSASLYSVSQMPLIPQGCSRLAAS